METIYAVLHKSQKLAYIGRTYRTLEQRWNEHLAGAADPKSTKTLYEYMRHDPDGFEIIECETSDTAVEHLWEQRFIEDGYRLLNDTGTNRVQPKKRNTAKEREWREINNRAAVLTAANDSGWWEEFQAGVQKRNADAWERILVANPEFKAQLTEPTAVTRQRLRDQTKTEAQVIYMKIRTEQGTSQTPSDQAEADAEPLCAAP